MSRMMNALVFDKPAPDASATRVARVPAPTPAPGQVAIAVSYAGINFKDVMARRGDPGYVDTWPFVPGLEVAGEVLAVGAGADGVAVGSRVVALTNAGGLAEQVVADAELVVPVPDGVSLAEAAAVPGGLTTARLLVHDIGRVLSGDVIAVHSASGAVGSAVPPLARKIGDVTLVGIVGAATRVEAAVQAGYDMAFVRGPGLAESVRSEVGRGVDLVLDPQGTAWLDEDLAMLRPSGRIVVFGNAGGGAFDALPPIGRFFGSNAAVGGFSLAALSAAEPARVRDAMSQVLRHMVDGDLVTNLNILRGLEMAARAQEHLAEGSGTGKYVIHVAGDD